MAVRTRCLAQANQVNPGGSTNVRREVQNHVQRTKSNQQRGKCGPGVGRLRRARAVVLFFSPG